MNNTQNVNNNDCNKLEQIKENLIEIGSSEAK